ncbi:MAG: carbohydrate kinase family protein [Acidobacteriota bacterium]|nr:carbohydrate kinase family protein [Acidobacteriota bacterium]
MPRFDVTIAGELNLDLILYGLPDELPLERELLADGMILTLGGSSAIVAHNLATLGSRVGFQSRIGDDELGSIALRLLTDCGVNTSLVRRVPGPTKSGLSVILQRAAARNILTYLGTIAELTESDLDTDFLADSRHFHLSSYYLQTKLQPHVTKLLRQFKDAGLTLSLDTNDDPSDRWEDGLREVVQCVDVFLPNAREACRIAGTQDVKIAAARLAELVPLVVVKLGREGSMAQRGSEISICGPLKVDAVDAVGAGDSFDAGFLHKFVQGADLSACLRSGNAAGALSTTRPGGTEAFRDREHRENFFRRYAGTDSGGQR